MFDRLRIHPFFSFIIPLPTLVLGLLASFCLVTRGLETVLRLRFYVRTENRGRVFATASGISDPVLLPYSSVSYRNRANHVIIMAPSVDYVML